MHERLTFGSLFSGIGGLDLGLERAGWRCAWQVELDPFCRAVLAQHWPDVHRASDIRECHAEMAHAERERVGIESRGGDGASGAAKGAVQERQRRGDNACASCLTPVDLIVGGFPCQPYSVAGKRKGAADERALWPEFARLIGVLRPRLALLENVPGLLSVDGGRQFGAVLADLAALGYDTEWDCVPAAAVGAPHLRWRVFVVAHADRRRCQQRQPNERAVPIADALSDVPHSDGAGRGEHGRPEPISAPLHSLECSGTPDANCFEAGWLAESWTERDQWRAEPDVGRVAHGVSARVDRLRSLGNAVVPAVAEMIGRRLLEVAA